MNKYIRIIFILVIFVFAFFAFQYAGKKLPIVQLEETNQEDVQSQIDNYQTEYWTIIKKHNLFLYIGESDNDIEKDRTDLNNLCVIVENKINKNNQFLKELKYIENKYDESIKNAQTQAEMNILAGKYLDETDSVLNKVYQEIKRRVNQNDFEKLKTSEIKWIETLENYESLINEQGYGSIAGLLYAKAIQDVKKFRTLLLIFYLEQKRIIKS